MSNAEAKQSIEAVLAVVVARLEKVRPYASVEEWTEEFKAVSSEIGEDQFKKLAPELFIWGITKKGFEPIYGKFCRALAESQRGHILEADSLELADKGKAAFYCAQFLSDKYAYEDLARASEEEMRSIDRQRATDGDYGLEVAYDEAAGQQRNYKEKLQALNGVQNDIWDAMEKFGLEPSEPEDWAKVLSLVEDSEGQVVSTRDQVTGQLK